MPTQTPNRNVYDDEGRTQPLTGDDPPADPYAPAGNPADPRGDVASGDPSDPRDSYGARQQTAAGDSSDPRGDGTVSRGMLDTQEGVAGSGAATSLDKGESSFANRLSTAEEKGSKGTGGLYRDEGEGGGGVRDRITSLRGRFGRFTKKRIATVAIVGVLGGGGILGFSILQGPFQFVHFAQNLQKHFRSNNDFGNDRTSKVLLYALAGKGAQNGKLGITGNIAANKFEKRILDNLGIKPLYSSSFPRRFVGYQIVDQVKAEKFLGDIKGQDQKGRRANKVQRSMGKGAEVVKADDVRNGNGTKVGLLDGDNNPVRGSVMVINLSKQSFDDRRAATKTTVGAAGYNNIAGALGSRLLIKRAGVNFHPLNKARDKGDGLLANRKEKRDKRAAEMKERRNKTISDGVPSQPDAKAAETEDTNGDGKNEAKQPDVDGTTKANEYVEKFKNGGAINAARGPAVVVAVFCMAKSYGGAVEEYKFANNVMPMMRLGVDSVAMGNQTMSGDDIDLEALGIMSEYMYDKENKTSWIQAESIRGEQGKEGGTPMPKEADLGTATEKPELFKTLDGVPVLPGICGAVDAVTNAPIIGDILGAITDASTAAIDVALKRAGTSTDELFESSLKAVAGKSVDPEAKGADFGNFANTGTFLAANDQAIATGGRALTDGERTNLAMVEADRAEEEHAAKSFASRYFDIYDHRSVAGSLIDKAPVNSSHAVAMISNPVKIIGSSFSDLFSTFIPKAKAAGNYDYGVPKYGFSLAERRDPLYENPYANGQRQVRDPSGNLITLEEDLPRLNEEYGDCFGMTVTAEADGVHIQSADKSVNVFELNKDPKLKEKCNASKNRDDRFNQYRFYIADAVTAISLACFEGKENYCQEIGASSGGTADTEEAAVDGDAADLAKQILENKNIDISAGNFCRYCTEDIKNTAEGKPAFGNVKLDKKLLAFLLELGKQTKVDVNSISGAGSGHSANSNHYKGIAIDFGCNGISGSVLDKTAAKYDIKSNFERCDAGINHWHYSIGGR